MASPPFTTMPFEILDAVQGPPGTAAFYRVRVGSSIKYLVAASPLLYGLPDTRGERLAFNNVPGGDWNVANLVPNTEQEHKLVLASTEKRLLPSVGSRWCPSEITMFDIKDALNPSAAEQLQLSDHFHAGVFPGPQSMGVSRVLAFWHWEFSPAPWLAQESRIHSMVQGLGITPKFLGHITENQDRVIGYLLEPVAAREANIGDIGLCHAVLKKLHSLGIAHGCIRRSSFLILEDGGSALLRSFHSSFETTDQEILGQEMLSLDTALQQPLPVSRQLSDDASEQLTAVQERDGQVHPLLFWQAENEGRITVTENEHKEMLAIFEQNGRRWTKEDTEKALHCREENGGRWVPLAI